MNNHTQWMQQFEKNSHIGILVVDKERNNLFVNDRLCEMFGYTKETLLATNTEVFHVNHDTFLQFADLAFLAVLEGHSLGIDYQLKREDGSLFWVHISGDPIAENKEVLWTMVDISQRIEAQENIKALKERMELALLGSSDGLFDLNLQDNTVYYSPRWKEMLGYKDEELKNSVETWELLVHPEDRDNVWAEIQEHIDGKTKYVDNVHRLKHKEGHWVWIRDRAKAIFDENGKATRIIGTHTNISAEKALQLKYTQQAQMIEQTHDAVVAADLDGIITNWNHGAEILLGYTAEEIIGQNLSILYQKEDLEALQKNKITLLETGEFHTDRNFVKKTKDIVMASLSGSILKDEAGNPTHMVGYAQDITQRKKAEIELKEQHKYLQSIINGVDDPIMVIQEDYSVSLMNNYLRKTMQNINISDSQNPKCYEISHHRSTPCDGIEHPCPLRDVLETGKHVKVVHTHDTLKGKNSFVELAATPLFDTDKNCVGIIESARDITQHLKVQDELRTQKEALKHQAYHDALTGLPNRVLFNDRLTQAIEKAKRSSSQIAVLFIDLDHFKEINDSLGHDIGDEVLKIVSNRLKDVIRNEDTLSRLGGDEFTVIIEAFSLVEDISFVADKILKTLAHVIVLNNTELYVSSSIGISIYPNDALNAQSLLKFADSAMYKAKREGRNNYQYYDTKLTERAFKRVVMEASLRSGIKNEEFVVYYQPQVDERKNTIVGMEALVRWNHPTMGLVSPDSFIPLAESTGLVVELDRFVMKKAMTQLTTWYKDGLNPGVLAMNLAIKQLQSKDFIEVFQKLMQETGCKSEWIELEVTETQIMTKPEEAIEILTKISDLGIELAVDDFGTGYSSLAYLKKLPINKLKIDQAFVRDLPDDEEDACIAKAVIALAKSLNLRVIAEGVEKKEQRDFIVENGCDTIQGYFHSKPVPADEFEIILRNGFEA